MISTMGQKDLLHSQNASEAHYKLCEVKFQHRGGRSSQDNEGTDFLPPKNAHKYDNQRSQWEQGKGKKYEADIYM